ncbi:MAG: hypothetical protein Q9168_004096 [Polycauliona sp. 1 TL-2023]
MAGRSTSAPPLEPNEDAGEWDDPIFELEDGDTQPGKIPVEHSYVYSSHDDSSDEEYDALGINYATPDTLHESCHSQDGISDDRYDAPSHAVSSPKAIATIVPGRASPSEDPNYKPPIIADGSFLITEEDAKIMARNFNVKPDSPKADIKPEVSRGRTSMELSRRVTGPVSYVQGQTQAPRQPAYQSSVQGPMQPSYGQPQFQPQQQSHTYHQVPTYAQAQDQQYAVPYTQAGPQCHTQPNTRYQHQRQTSMQPQVQTNAQGQDSRHSMPYTQMRPQSQSQQQTQVQRQVQTYGQGQNQAPAMPYSQMGPQFHSQQQNYVQSRGQSYVQGQESRHAMPCTRERPQSQSQQQTQMQPQVQTHFEAQTPADATPYTLSYPLTEGPWLPMKGHVFGARGFHASIITKPEEEKIIIRDLEQYSSNWQFPPVAHHQPFWELHKICCNHAVEQLRAPVYAEAFDLGNRRIFCNEIMMAIISGQYDGYCADYHAAILNSQYSR